MLKIECPYCGLRDENEFRYGGEAHRDRPADPEALSDSEWADFLFMRKNTKGLTRERWNHAQGCRRWFNLLRDSTSHRIIASYEVGSKPEVTGLLRDNADQHNEGEGQE